MSEVKFYYCEHCGNVVELINDSGAAVVCCGQKMTRLVPGTVDASREKHIPVVTVEEGLLRVKVGSVTHPMTEEHSIQWIYLATERGGQRRNLEPGEAPEAVFALADEKPIAVYAYCNIHGLWKADI